MTFTGILIFHHWPRLSNCRIIWLIFRSSAPFVTVNHECTSLHVKSGHVTYIIIAHHSLSLPVAKGHYIMAVQVNTETVSEAHLIMFYAPWIVTLGKIVDFDHQVRG